MTNSSSTTSNTSGDNKWQDIIINDTSELVELQTWRDGTPEKEKDVQSKLNKILAHFIKKMDTYNGGKDEALQMRSFEWLSDDDGDESDLPKYRVFGFRAGKGPRKVSIICHLDTVPPGNDDWNPFEPRVETRVYNGVPTDFLIGRGSIDDKGPAVVAFEAFTRALRSANETALENVTLEVLYDTSEETDMATPHYFDAVPGAKPAFGIVFDAYWSVRAEKGIERPTFSIHANDGSIEGNDSQLFIATLSTPPAPANMIPVTAEAHVAGRTELLKYFADNVGTWYRAYPFDDSDYHPADISVTNSGSEVVITAKVAGAQHGSAPEQNRANGANPVVSLTNFLASLVDRGLLANNHNGKMCRFIRWAFGTRVFGENHPDLLQRFDTVFKEGNGTTYALTQLIQADDKGGTMITLGLDIRYAIGHHGIGWDGKEGKLTGESLFKSIFEQLIDRYHAEAGGQKLMFQTATVFGPDIRSLRDDNLFRINTAYRAIMGNNCPMQATGGATDAHGYLELVTAGALFTTSFGPPVNYHGIDEGAPLIDLENSGKILLELLQKELCVQTSQAKHYAAIHHAHGCCN